MTDQIVIVDVVVTEFVDGQEVNKATWRSKGSQEFVPLTARLLAAFAEPASSRPLLLLTEDGRP